mmetsp:Transcript_4985/g.12253  ORF Transcript_4985/g.12253 Transcript_4985/m.12253 type:complete len:229 (+) Transcript_4985:2503-3189(+)
MAGRRGSAPSSREGRATPRWRASDACSIRAAENACCSASGLSTAPRATCFSSRPDMRANVLVSRVSRAASAHMEPHRSAELMAASTGVMEAARWADRGPREWPILAAASRVTARCCGSQAPLACSVTRRRSSASIASVEAWRALASAQAAAEQLGAVKVGAARAMRVDSASNTSVVALPTTLRAHARLARPALLKRSSLVRDTAAIASNIALSWWPRRAQPQASCHRP